jgi:hypothetical protein
MTRIRKDALKVKMESPFYFRADLNERFEGVRDLERIMIDNSFEDWWEEKNPGRKFDDMNLLHVIAKTGFIGGCNATV